MSCYLQVLATDSIDSSACIALFTESHRFLFNCGEGIQRLCVEHKVRLSKIRALLFTDFSPQNSFGLPGLALTAADAGNSNIRVGGPPQLRSFLRTTRYFMKLNDGLLNFHTTTEKVSTVFNSNEVDIRMIAFKTENENLAGVIDATEHLTVHPENAHTCGSVQRNCFVCSTQELKGKFDLSRAQALKVPKGPLFGQLKNGQTITLEDGTIIAPDMVLGEGERKKYFVVVCSIQPHETQLLLDITTSSELNRFHLGQQQEAQVDNGDGLKCIVHLSPADTVYCAAYQAWIKGFGADVTHIYTGAGTSPITHSSFLATTTQCQKLHLTCPEMFPAMRSTYRGLYCDVPGSVQGSDGDGVTNAIAAVPLMKFHFLPVRNKGVEYAASVECSAAAVALFDEAVQGENSEAVRSALGKVEEVRGVVRSSGGSFGGVGNGGGGASSTGTIDVTKANTTAATSTVNATADVDSIHHTYGTNSPGATQLLNSGVRGSLSFLGTGCSIPSKYRNVSGILLQISNNSSEISGSGSDSSDSSGLRNGLLIDAGEGTWAQMLRIAYEHAYSTTTNTSNITDNTNITTTSTDTASTTSTTAPTLRTLQHSLAALLKVVWVSHPHADHHLGLVRVIAERKSALCSVLTNDSSTGSGKYTTNITPFTPLLVIAPPSILAFLHEYSVLYPYLHNAYTPVSCRAFDPADSCLYTDCYWNARLLCNSTNNAISGNDGNDGSGGSGGNSEQEAKRQRTHSPARDITDTDTATATTTTSTTSNSKKVTRGDQYSLDCDNSAEMRIEDTISNIAGTTTTTTSTTTTSTSTTGSKTAAADILHSMLHNPDNSTICNMSTAATSDVAMDTTNTTATTTTTTATKSWRNFASVFKEAIPAEVLKIASEAKSKADAVLCSMGVVGLKNIQVIHCGQSYGLCVTIAGGGTGCSSENSASTVFTGSSGSNTTTINPAITSPNNLTLAYSGDTRPCPALIAHCTHTTVLIHEATFEDTKYAEAVSKRHSTMQEAYSVGREMGAFRTIFTHFSQRYPGVPLLGDYSSTSVNGTDGTDGVEQASSSNGGDSSGCDDGSSMKIADSANTAEPTTTTTTSTTINTTPHVAPILAFDYMHIQLQDLLWAPAVTAVMSAAYPGKAKNSPDEEE